MHRVVFRSQVCPLTIAYTQHTAVVRAAISVMDAHTHFFPHRQHDTLRVHAQYIYVTVPHARDTATRQHAPFILVTNTFAQHSEVDSRA
jgi:hypothetical protein